MENNKESKQLTQNTDNVCEYAETALEHYMKESYRLKEENKQLREQIKRLLWMMEEQD